ncbi:MAG: hypothetical protein LKF36_07470 [Lactobacillus sp.]|jgi:hypothetical protein|nr:hypothetical protein [Lactobacillus sp.]
MTTFLIALLSVVLIVFIYYIVKRVRRNAALKILLRHSQKITDKMFVATLEAGATTYQQVFDFKADLTSDPVQKIWGRGIMVFEYKMQIKDPAKHDAAFFKAAFFQKFENQLNEQAADNGIISAMPKYTPFIISDYWVLDGFFHVDVAFMTNKPTIEYVKDMRKADLEKLQTHGTD